MEADKVKMIMLGNSDKPTLTSIKEFNYSKLLEMTVANPIKFIKCQITDKLVNKKESYWIKLYRKLKKKSIHNPNAKVDQKIIKESQKFKIETNKTKTIKSDFKIK